MTKAFEYILKLNGISRVTAGLQKVATFAGKASKSFGNLQETAIKAKYFGDAFQEASTQLESLSQAGVAYESSMADLQAITGLTGEKLDAVGMSARKNAIIFGGEASQSVESYKLLLSQLGPAIAQNPKALELMGKNVSLLSKTMRGNTIAATEVLTAAMNQYGVDLTNPIQATAKMSEYMNIMSAAAKEGSSELPSIKLAVENVGSVAKDAGLKFSTMNASIQLLDKYGKKGAEGGVALRNVLGTLSKGRFMPKTVLAELKQAGVDVQKLADKTVPFTERLRELSVVQNDAALIGSMFGTENKLAAMALIKNANAIDVLDNKIVGTNTTTEQAQIIMNTYAEKMKRARAVLSDLGIQLFDVSKKYLPAIQFSSEFLTIAGRLSPVVMAAGKAFSWATKQLFKFAKSAFKAGLSVLKFAGKLIFSAVYTTGTFVVSLFRSTVAFFRLKFQTRAATKANMANRLSNLKNAMSLTLFKNKIALAGKSLSILGKKMKAFSFKGFVSGLWQAGKQAVISAAKWVWSGVVGLGTYMASLITATAAQIGLNIAMNANPIGIIILGLIALGTAVYLIIDNWNVIKSWLAGLVEYVKYINPFNWLIKIIDSLFPGFTEMLGNWWTEIVSFFSGIVDFFMEVYNDYIAPVMGLDGATLELNTEYNSTNKDNEDALFDENGFPTDPNKDNSTITQGVSDINSGGKKQTNITINYERLIEHLNIHSQNVQEGVDDMTEIVENALIKILNSGNSLANG